MKPKLLFIYDYFYPAYQAGGIVQSLYNLETALKDKFDVKFICSTQDLSGEKIEVLTERYNMSQGSVFKNELSDLIIQHITPIGKEIQRLQTDLSYVDLVMTEGAKRASIIAAETMKEVRSHCGYM